MAKGVGLIGNVSGKLGNTVGYTIKNSRTKETQGWRIYQPNVKNPQTYGQMTQRVKMTAINNFYRALRTTIQRGFEGVQYGDPSRRAWLKMAMGREFEGPYLPKGSKVAVPIVGIPVTVGSLNGLTLAWNSQQRGFAVSGLYSSFSTVAELSQALISRGYMSGDQVTIVFAFPLGESYGYTTVEFYLDTTDATVLSSLGVVFSASTGQTYLSNPSNTAVAALIAISRDGDGSHLRSTSYFAISPSVTQAWYNITNYDDVVSTYLKGSSSTTDWQLTPTRGAGGQTSTSVETILKDGNTVTVTGWRMVGEQLYFLNENGSPAYVAQNTYSQTATFEMYIKSTAVWSDDAPADATDANTISFNSGSSASAAQTAFINWLLDNGFSYQFIFLYNPT